MMIFLKFTKYMAVIEACCKEFEENGKRNEKQNTIIR